MSLYFLLRLPNLTSQPIFVDEAIYIRWAQVMRAEPSLRFLPQASEGKQPLFMWFMIPMFKVFEDPLLAGRFLSTVTGLGTLMGIIFLTYYLFRSKKVASVAGLIYTVSPFSVFFDRMALVDSMLAMFSIWTLILGIFTAKYLRLDFAMLTGFALGGALLTKSPAIFFEIMLPLTWIISNWPKGTKQKIFHLLKLSGLSAVTLFIANGMYNILRLGPSFNQIAIQNQKYVFEISHLWINPKDPFIYHLKDMSGWFLQLGPGLLMVFVLLGLFGLKKYFKSTVLILFWSLIPLFAINMYAKVFTARYILYTMTPIFILASLVFLNKGNVFRKILIPLFVIFIIQAIWLDYLLLTNPQKLPLPKSERSGYFEEWSAGYNLKEIAQFLQAESKDKTVVVGTEGTFGTLPEGLQIYLDKVRNVVIIGGSGYISDQIRETAKEHPTYFVANKSRIPQGLGGVSLLKEYPKAVPEDGSLQDAILLFQVLP